MSKWSLTKILGEDSDVFFGERRYPFDSPLLETVHRYLELKKYNQGLDKIELINTFTTSIGYDIASISKFAEEIDEYNYHLLLVERKNANVNELNSDVPLGYESLSEGRIPVAALLTAKKYPTSIFVNKAKKRTIIVTDNVSISGFTEMLASLYPAVIPWFFDGYAYDDEDQALFQAIANGDTETFKKIVNKQCEQVNFYETKWKGLLKNWSSNLRIEQIKRLEKQNELLSEEIARRWTEICQKNVDMQLNSETITALKVIKEDNEPDALFKFFQSRKIKLSCTGSVIQGRSYVDFFVKAKLENYDADEFEAMYKNPNSYIYGRSISQKSRSVCYAIFVKQRGVFRAEAAFRLTDLNALEPRGQIMSGDGDAIPHPHLYNFRCLGANGQYILRYLQAGQWDLAIDQAIQATMNINFGDSVVVSRFMETLPRYNGLKCIIADNGEEMTFDEFANYISENEESESIGS